MVYSIWALVRFITSLDLFEPGSASLLMEPITLFLTTELYNILISIFYFFFSLCNRKRQKYVLAKANISESFCACVTQVNLPRSIQKGNINR